MGTLVLVVVLGISSVSLYHRLKTAWPLVAYAGIAPLSSCIAQLSPAPLNVLGLAVSICGIIYYNYIKQR